MIKTPKKPHIIQEIENYEAIARVCGCRVSQKQAKLLRERHADIINQYRVDLYDCMIAHIDEKPQPLTLKQADRRALLVQRRADVKNL